MACNLHVSFTVPGPVVPWQRAASVGARRFTPAKQRAYQANVRMHALAARPRGPWLPSKHARYRVDVEAYLPDERRRDLDNIAKTILDALNGVLYLDARHRREAAKVQSCARNVQTSRANVQTCG
jgi:Holliday junction resolvase RusA-like endonuclease